MHDIWLRSATVAARLAYLAISLLVPYDGIQSLAVSSDIFATAINTDAPKYIALLVPLARGSATVWRRCKAGVVPWATDSMNKLWTTR